MLIGAGMVLISTTTSFAMWLLGFGVLGGMGMGFGYSSATPPALKWFPAAKTGLIAASSSRLRARAGLSRAALEVSRDALPVAKVHAVPGISFLVAIVGLSQLLRNPPAGYIAGGASAGSKPAATGLAPGEIVRTPSFWILWLIYFAGAGAGLMVISSISGMAKTTMRKPRSSRSP